MSINCQTEPFNINLSRNFKGETELNINGYLYTIDRYTFDNLLILN